MKARSGDATIVVVGLAVLVLLTPVRRLLASPGMPLWLLFAAWSVIIVGAAWANRERPD